MFKNYEDWIISSKSTKVEMFNDEMFNIFIKMKI